MKKNPLHNSLRRITHHLSLDIQHLNERTTRLEEYLSSAENLEVIGGIRTTQFADCACIGDDRGPLCSGVLIHPRVVLTAAHCLDNKPKWAFFGESVWDPDSGERVLVREAIPHPQFRRSGGAARPSHDIAVLILDAPAPVAATSLRALPDHVQQLTVVGFGTTNPDGDDYGVGIKREAPVPVVPPTEADPTLLDFYPETEFVAGRQDGRDTCAGDSGGPAYMYASGQPVVVGLTSRGVRGAARCGNGGIYTRVEPYRGWIRTTAAVFGLDVLQDG